MYVYIHNIKYVLYTHTDIYTYAGREREHALREPFRAGIRQMLTGISHYHLLVNLMQRLLPFGSIVFHLSVEKDFE